MTHENFIWWLKGFCELTPQPPTPEQWQAIKEHLDTFFTKVTPKAPGDVTPTTNTTKTEKEKNQDILEQLIKNVRPATKPDNPLGTWPYRPYVVPDWPTYTPGDKLPNPLNITC